MDREPPKLKLIESEQLPKRKAVDIGHYFDQSVFDLQYTLLVARTRNMALDDDLAALGVTVDPETGEVTLQSAAGKSAAGPKAD